MYKIRSMRIDSDKSGVVSTASGDSRITAVGKVIRRFKIDELSQLFNVIIGTMSLVGPRPLPSLDADILTPEERKVFDVKPGITDFSSIVFADEGEILEPYTDPDLAYNQLIRPWKSRLGLIYASNVSVRLDFFILWRTALVLANRNAALQSVADRVKLLGGDDLLVQVCRRLKELEPSIPLGATEVFKGR